MNGCPFTHGLTPHSIPVWTAIILASNESAKPLKSAEIESIEQAVPGVKEFIQN
ncbi:hypothetical protein [Paenibacillus kribbensis]|uniref:hypothetical protein n=1 Tax=Paenibacillus kribbensis TaxID=172713 RepID=UPI00159F0F4C|nr:hypothetical protein [Paenibacillus kribbensis]